MAKEYIFVKGKGSWARVYTPDQWDAWSITVHPEADDLETIRDLQAQGLKNVIKKDDDGYYVKFRRPINKMIRGKIVAFEPPKVLDKDNVPMDGVAIGNGSDVTLKVEIYEHGTPGGGKAKAARLDSVRVDNLVKFEGDRDFTDNEREQVSGLVDQPERLF